MNTNIRINILYSCQVEKQERVSENGWKFDHGIDFEDPLLFYTVIAAQSNFKYNHLTSVIWQLKLLVHGQCQQLFSYL